MAHACSLGSPKPTRCRRGTLIIVSIFCVALAVGLAVSVAMFIKERSSRQTPGGGGSLSKGHAPTQAIARTCRATLYPELCISDLMGFPGAGAAGDADLVPMSLNATRRHVLAALANASALGAGGKLLAATQAAAALRECVELLDAAAELLERSVGAITAAAPTPSDYSTALGDDVMTWLSAALTYHDTCNDSLQEIGSDDVGRIKAQMLGYIDNLGEHISNSLAIFKARGSPDGGISGGVPVHDQLLHRRVLASDDSDDVINLPPRWVKHGDRRLLQVPAADIKPNIVVAQDGGGGAYRNISAAIEAAPEYSHSRFVIHVKAGVYIENVKVGRNKTNLMLVGDGVGKTVVIGYRSVQDKLKAFETATLAVSGEGFMMRDMTVENRAGPEKYQAVAVLVSADHAVVYRCAILGYQDTLYAHAQRQFYRDCEVAGTVDAVFGNAAVVLQNCTLTARRPLPRQKNTATAQGRTDPNQNTGISVHGCRLLPAPELAPVQSEYPTYLGRPWKPYARVVYMMSFMESHVHAAGWLAWDASGSAPDTIYYGEYQNYGPGAAVEGRVAWLGHRVITLAVEAMEFSVGTFIGGCSWLPSTGVPFVAGLTG